MKIAVGLSGGVDSSVAAFLLKQAGHEVTGITMRIVEDFDTTGGDARRVAEHLEIPLHILDLRSEYEKTILKYIREDYAAGRTPNPCVRCNHEVKFGLFIARALESGLDFEKFATGHYARIRKNPETGRFGLSKGTFADKDQAYFLSLLVQEQLARTVFPLGEMNKDEVREIAKEAGLFTHKKGESQDLCLGNYRQFLVEGRGAGEFVDTSGKVLGQHKGIEHYTIGQRRGLGIGAGHPLYVLEIDTSSNRIILGLDEELASDGMIIGDISWGVVSQPALPYGGTVKIRYRDDGSPATLAESLPEGEFRILFDKPRRAVTPGQLAVFYQGEEVAFAGFIRRAI
ncbi:MAG: tRNA 2-thiouridine(34) synthase MnmA [Spirochaetales bacterium]|nr:tRNA 2-thiouridine(34) synthase MnmA [Spirochaetales bacterium]